MYPKNLYPSIAIFGLCSLAGCSQTTPAPAAIAQAAAGSSAGNSAVAATGGSDSNGVTSANIDCAKIFGPADAAGMLKGNVTVGAEKFRDNACVFESEDHSNIELLYSGSGIGVQVVWQQASGDAHDYKPLGGVGDQAFYSDGSAGGPPQVLGKQGEHFCSATAGGSGFKLSGEALAVQLGALCNKLFAAH